MVLLETNHSVLPGLVILGSLGLICAAVWLLNRLLRRMGVREHHVDRVGSGLLEVERLVRPRAEHVLSARRQRKAEQANADDEPPE